MAFFLIFFTLSSIGLPGLNGFVGEFLVLLGTAISHTTRDGLPTGPLHYGYVIPAATGIILGAVYMLWMCQRVLFGPLQQPPHTPDTSAGLSRDLNRREIWTLVPIAAACLVIGVYPKPVLNSMKPAIARQILHIEPIGADDSADRAYATVPDPSLREGRGTKAVPVVAGNVNAPRATASSSGGERGGRGDSSAGWHCPAAGGAVDSIGVASMPSMDPGSSHTQRNRSG
jgi:hypothetical protein